MQSNECRSRDKRLITYVYECPNCGRSEIKQSIHDDALATCSQCSSSIRRVFQPAEVLWKGKFKWMKRQPYCDADKEGL